MIVTILILTCVIVVSSLPLVSMVFLRFGGKTLQEILTFVVAFASGALLGAAFFHLLYKSQDVDHMWPLTLAGLILFFCIEKLLHWRHCHRKECEVHDLTHANLVGSGIHNCIDGIIIATAFLKDIPMGLIISLAIITHELPQKMEDLHIWEKKIGRKKALLQNLLSSSIILLGAFAILLLHARGAYVDFLLPMAAGGFICIACTDFIPELHENVDLKATSLQMAFMFAGIGIMWLLR